MIKEDQKKNKKNILWIVGVVTFMTLVICILKYTSLKVLANEFNDTFYYGDAKSSYTKIDTSGRTVYSYPQGTLIFLFNLWDKQYLGICCRRYNLVQNGSNLWGLYRKVAVYDNTGTLTSYNLYDFYQMEGYSSDNFYTINGVEYVIRTMEMSTPIEGLPYFFVWSNRTEGPRMILESYISGVKSYMEGVTIGEINASIDTSNIEQLITDSNIIAQNTSTNIATITQDVGELKNGSGSGSGLNEEEKKLLVRYDLWLVLIFFCVGLHMVRGIIRSIGNRIRKV